MNLLLPVGGLSSRYPGVRPKWMLTHPSGDLMILKSIEGINIDDFKNIFIIALQQHEDEYKFSDGVLESFSKKYPNINTKIILLKNPTSSQPETVYCGIKKENISGFICIKDCDNFFNIHVKPINFIAFCNLEKNVNVKAANKSYIQINEFGLLENIVEKKVISPFFSCGAYGFVNAELFVEYYEACKNNDNLYLSHIMYRMLLDSKQIAVCESENYKDWGTLEDWKNYTSDYKTYFVDIDGVLVQNSSQYFFPRWGQSDPIRENINKINELYDSGKCQIILTSARKESFREQTEKQLNESGLRYHSLILGLLHGQRIVINDFSNTNSYPSCKAVNIERNSNNLKKYIE